MTSPGGGSNDLEKAAINTAVAAATATATAQAIIENKNNPDMTAGPNKVMMGAEGTMSPGPMQVRNRVKLFSSS